MSISLKCASCQNLFDTLRRTPLKLPCSHSLCQNCIYEQFERSQKNICLQQNCAKISLQHPRQLQEDKKVIELLIQEQNQKDQQAIKTKCQQLRNKHKKNKETIQNILKSQKVQKEIFAGSNALALQMLKQQKVIEQLIRYYENIVKLKETQNFNQIECKLQALDEIINDEILLKGKEQLDKLNQAIIQIQQNLQSFLLNQINNNLQVQKISDHLIQEKQIQEQNLDKSENQIRYKELKNISTIKQNSKIKKDYIIDENQIRKQQINIIQTYENQTQVEQLGEDQIIISGGSNEQNYQRFTIYDNGNIREMKMQYGRYYHKTVYDHKSKIYIFSGQHKNLIENCEIFNMEDDKFSLFQQILNPVSLFGALKDDGSLFYLTGGYLELNKIKTDLIQAYDYIQDK